VLRRALRRAARDGNHPGTLAQRLCPVGDQRRDEAAREDVEKLPLVGRGDERGGDLERVHEHVRPHVLEREEVVDRDTVELRERDRQRPGRLAARKVHDEHIEHASALSFENLDVHDVRAGRADRARNGAESARPVAEPHAERPPLHARRLRPARRDRVTATRTSREQAGTAGRLLQLPDVATLVLLRHGESTWNAENRFTGWVDVDLTPRGEAEARAAGRLLAEEDGIEVDVVHTSVLTRAVRTANLALEEMGRSYLPVRRHWRLNERHYGALQGLDKRETAALHGAEQVRAWRRGYRTPPPPLPRDHPSHPRADPRYRNVPPSALPDTECLADVVRRLRPYWEDAIAPDLFAGLTVLVVAHGNSLRALVKELEHIGDDEIVDLDIPTGIPRVYELSETLEPRSWRYLGDPEAARRAAEAVARQAG
jgi:2,3-bisphosphoglycerate-dependent phosphoglycerate mutase